MTRTLAAALAVVLSSALPAWATTVQTTAESKLAAAGSYVMLASTGTLNWQPGVENIGAGSTLYGNVGGATFLGLGAGDIVHGRADYGTQASIGSGVVIDQVGGGPGGATQQTAAYWAAIQTDLAAASTYLAGLSSNAAAKVNVTNPGTITTIAGFPATQLTSSGAGWTDVIDVGYLNLNGGTLVLNGSSTSTFVINVSNSVFQNTINAVTIQLAGGLTASNVYFNFTNTSGGLSIGLGGGNTLVGTFLAPNAFWNIGDGNTLGTSTNGFRLLTTEIVANTQKVYGLPPAPVPEPTSLALVGLAGLAVASRRGRRSVRA